MKESEIPRWQTAGGGLMLILGGVDIYGNIKTAASAIKEKNWKCAGEQIALGLFHG
jgi:hypothetical protein